MTAVDRWLIRAACIALVALALYGYSWALLDHYTWKVQVTQAINALGQSRGAERSAAPAPGSRP